MLYKSGVGHSLAMHNSYHW